MILTTLNTYLKKGRKMKLNSPFKPALNKDGYARVTFKVAGESSGTRKSDGTEYKVQQFIFEVLSGIRGQAPKLIKVNASFTLDVANPDKTRLGQILKALGFEFDVPEELENDEGFLISGQGNVENDDEGFAIEEDVVGDLGERIEEFLDELSENVYLGKVAQNNQGFWDIDINSLKLFKKAGEK